MNIEKIRALDTIPSLTNQWIDWYKQGNDIEKQYIKDHLNFQILEDIWEETWDVWLFNKKVMTVNETPNESFDLSIFQKIPKELLINDNEKVPVELYVSNDLIELIGTPRWVDVDTYDVRDLGLRIKWETNPINGRDESYICTNQWFSMPPNISMEDFNTIIDHVVEFLEPYRFDKQTLEERVFEILCDSDHDLEW